MPEIKQFDDGLRARLEEYRVKDRERPLTMSALGQELGVSSTRVNKYLAGKPEGNVAELETLVADLLRSAQRREVSDVPPFATNVTQILCATFDLARKTNDIALISGPAGIGKSVSAKLYRAAHPTTISVCVPRWQRSESGLAALLFEAIDARDWDGQTPKAVYMCNRLRASNRLIIIDNAQRLQQGAREWLFDFHDETGCPIALMGNPEVLVAIRRIDQHFSRIGIHQEVKLADKAIKTYALKMVEALVPSPQDGLAELAATVCEERGHLRALRKQIMLMRDLADTATYGGDQLKAFHAAHARLVRDYAL
jgi:DNA transposition AAA+ family ATPase